MNQFNKKMLEEWISERDEAAKSLDTKKFRAFFSKWQRRGVYSQNMSLPNDEVILISLHKMVCNMQSASEQEKQESALWLLDHGYDTEL